MGNMALMRGMFAAFGLVLALDAGLLVWAALDQRPDALPAKASLIVLEAWSNDAVTRQAFQLAQTYPGARLLSVGPLPERKDELEAEGACFPGASFAAKVRAQLMAWGLPADRVATLEQSQRGTHNEALLVRGWIREHGAQGGRVLVVTEWFHRQRSRLAFKSVMPDEDVRVVGGPPQLDISEWPVQDRRTVLFSEFLKLAYYQSKGLISLGALLQAPGGR